MMLRPDYSEYVMLFIKFLHEVIKKRRNPDIISGFLLFVFKLF